MMILIWAMFPLSAAATTTADKTLGAITFKTSNSKRVPLGKEIVLYLTVKDMGSIDTQFSCSNDSIAACEKLTNTSVRMRGLKEGEVTVTAEANGKKATYQLIVGGSSTTKAGSAAGVVNENHTPSEPEPNVEIDPFANYQDQLAVYVANNRRAGMGEMVAGLIGVGIIAAGIVLVVSVMFSSRSSRLTVSPGSLRGFGAAEYRGKRRKRLLPDSYYRQIHKY
ncbi:MAG: hypothetical protein FWE86_01880 [Oscillospiraceae bacterium]|nr:hypothetical protein [Oscillospiraceae bacterium]